MIDDKRQLIRAFNDCMAAFPSGRGRRNCELLPRAACLAVKMGMDESAFIDAVREVAADMGAADIRRTFRTAGRKVAPAGGFGSATWLRDLKRKTKAEPPRTFPHHVGNLINAGRDVRTFEGLMRLSPDPVAGLGRWLQMAHQLFRMFPGENDIVYIFRNDPPTPGVPGRSLMRVRDWLNERCPNPPTTAGELVTVNPLSGEQGETTDGAKSYIAQSCLAGFPHAVLEFDEMPLEAQCQFWAGFIRQSKVPLVCLAYSGGKSLHGCVHVGAADLPTWNAKRAQLAALFASDSDPALRADVQALRPRTGMRLAGAVRASTGKVQRLLWACACRRARELAGVEK